jgi:hypothetical protein
MISGHSKYGWEQQVIYILQAAARNNGDGAAEGDIQFLQSGTQFVRYDDRVRRVSSMSADFSA